MKLKVVAVAALVLGAGAALFTGVRAGPQTGAEPPSAGQDPLKVVIRPGAPGALSLEDMVIRSADGRLMFLYEWLTRPKTAFYDIDFFGPRPQEGDELRLVTNNFGMILGKEYTYLDFQQISQKFGKSSATQLASISSHRGVYIPATAERAFDPLEQTFGVLDFQGGLLRVPW